MEKAAENREKIRVIRSRMASGELTYDQAKIEAQPIINEINERAKEIAKKYNKRPALVTFAGIMR